MLCGCKGSRSSSKTGTGRSKSKKYFGRSPGMPLQRPKLDKERLAKLVIFSGKSASNLRQDWQNDCIGHFAIVPRLGNVSSNGVLQPNKSNLQK